MIASERDKVGEAALCRRPRHSQDHVVPRLGGAHELGLPEAELELRRESVATAKSWLARQEAAALQEDEDSASVDTSEEVDDGKQQEVDSSSTSESYVE